MSRENRYTAIILKKIPFNEGDEIITFFSLEQGKIRALAKSVKLQKSKLQARLQGLFLVDVTLTTGGLPKIISVEVEETFQSLRENLPAMKLAFYAIELVLKFTPDEQKNEKLFQLLVHFLNFLNSDQNQEILNLGLAKFKMEILNVLGLSIADDTSSAEVFFSPARGGFSGKKSAEGLTVSKVAYQAFLDLKTLDFMGLSTFNNSIGIHELQNFLSGFIEYQLERKVKSEKYLKQ